MFVGSKALRLCYVAEHKSSELAKLRTVAKPKKNVTAKVLRQYPTHNFVIAVIFVICTRLCSITTDQVYIHNTCKEDIRVR